MAIAPLQLPDPIRTPSIDWSQLNQIGDSLAGALRKRRISDVISAATGPDGTLHIEGAAAQLAKNGLLDEARPFLALAQQKAHLAQSAAGQAETARHNRAMEARADRALESKPELTWQEGPSGEKVPYIVDARRGTVAPVAVPGMTGQEPANPYAVGGKMTEAQSKDAGYATRMFESEQILTDPTVIAAGQSRVQRGYSATPFVGNSLVSPEYQQFNQATRNFINATLRRESGAAISESEFENARQQYLPQPGDSAAVLAQKAQNRRTVIEGFAASAGKGYRPKMIFDEGGKVVPNPASPRTQVGAGSRSQAGGADQILAEARAAIKAGKDPAAVAARLREFGVDPGRL